MNWSNDPLWRALAEMRITPERAALSFTAKLARERGWSTAHAEAVVEEYRRFLYLGATGKAAVTPSADVDQAWHLHLSYSRHYWDVLCGSILKRPFHHEPSTGGPGENARHHAQYRATLARYRATFGVAPPPTVWPISPRRFLAQPPGVDRAHYWQVTGRTLGIASASLSIAACAALAGNGSADRTYGVAVPLTAGALVLVVVALVIARARNSGKRRNRDGSGGSDCGSDCSSDTDSDSDGGSSCGGSGCGGGGGD